MSKSKKNEAETAQIETVETVVDKTTEKKKKVYTPRVIEEDGLYAKSAAQKKCEDTIEKYMKMYEENGVLSPHDARILVNAKEKLEDKSASKLFNFAKQYIKNPANKEMVAIMLGENELPEDFKEFCALLPQRQRQFSKWDAFGVFTKLNKGAAQKAKAVKQEKAQALAA